MCLCVNTICPNYQSVGKRSTRELVAWEMILLPLSGPPCPPRFFPPDTVLRLPKNMNEWKTSLTVAVRIRINLTTCTWRQNDRESDNYSNTILTSSVALQTPCNILNIWIHSNWKQLIVNHLIVYSFYDFFFGFSSVYRSSNFNFLSIS